MKRAAGAIATVAATAAAFIACDLELQPYVEPDDAAIPGRPDTTGVDAAEPPKDAEPKVDSGTTDASDGATPGPKRVFVTSKRFNGGFGGLQGADAQCQQAATDAKLPGTFVAWVSVSNKSAISRINDVGPWFLVDGTTLVFANRNAIVTTGPEVPIDHDETNTKVADPTPELVWTGTGQTGEPAGQNCNEFTFGINGLDGLSGSFRNKGQQWTQAQVVSCQATLRLYCFEQ